MHIGIALIVLLVVLLIGFALLAWFNRTLKRGYEGYYNTPESDDLKESS